MPPGDTGHPRHRRELRRYQQGAFVLVGAALVLAAALVPRGDELLLIHVKNRDITRARALLAEGAAHVSTAASVVAHDELFLLEGRVDEALVTLEAYAESRPDDVEAWTRLARMYADAQRLNDQIRASAHVYRLKPAGALARRLATLYRWNGDESAEATVLRDVAAGDDATAVERVRSARLDAALGKPAQALKTLEAMRRHDPGTFDYATLELYASLLLHESGAGHLALPIRLLPLVRTEPDTMAALARALTSWGRADAAVALFDTPPGEVAPAARLAMRARVATGTSEAPRIVGELASIDATRPLATEPLTALVDLSLSLQDYGTVEAVLGNPAQPANPVLAGLAIGHAVAHGARNRAQALISRLGDAGLADSPLMAIELAVERGDIEGAERWIHKVDASAGLPPEEVAALAQFEVRLGLADRAFTRLASLAAAGRAPEWALNDLSQLAVKLGRADEVLHLLSASASAMAHRAWARLAAVAGRTDLIDSWLASMPPQAFDGDTMRDVYFLLADRGHTELAVRTAERLFKARGSPQDALLLGQALLAAGRPVDALAPLGAANAGDADAQLAYDAALAGALRAGADVASDLRRVFAARLMDARVSGDYRTMLVEGLWAAGERASLADDIRQLAEHDLDRWLSPLVESAVAAGEPNGAVALITARLQAGAGEGGGADVEGPAGGRRSALVRALMDLDAPDLVLLPELELMAQAEGGSWVYAYDERLALRSMTAKRVDLWSAIGRSPHTPPADRRSAAARLVELGSPAAATAVFEDLAASAGPDDPDLLQLLYLWGVRPGQPQLAWLVQRMQTAPSSDWPRWIGHIVQAGGAGSVVLAMPTLPADASPALVDAWVGAHQATADRWLVRDALQQVLLRPNPGTEDLRVVGRTALAHEFSGLAADAFGAIAARDPHDLESLHWLGALSFYEGQTARARRWLAAYVAAGGHEAESLYQLGELALAERAAARARQYFGQALEYLGDPSAQVNQPLLANVLVRRGERERAASTFEAILADNPALDHVRADYAVAALQWGDDGLVRRILDGAPGNSEAEAPALVAGGGSKRLDLLRIEWLTHEGRYGDALHLLDSLSARYPSDADVLLTRARFDEGRGRPLDADRGYELARQGAALRDDIDRIVRERLRQQSPRAAIETEGRTISGGWDEQYERLTAGGQWRPHAPVALSFERLRLSAPQVRLPDGRVAPIEADLRRFDASATMRAAPGTTVGGAVFGTSSGVGTGLTLSHDDLRGRSEVTAEFGRPFWEFLESAADDGRRDRVGVQRQWRFRPDTAVWVQAGANRYRLASGASTESAALSLGVVRTIRQAAPSITLQYGLDKEHRLRASVSTTPEGQEFVPVPLVSREVHLFGAVSRFAVARDWEVEATGGYTFDRLGGRGSFVTARLVPPASARVGVELWADRRLFALATTQRVLKAGARLTVRF